MSEAADNRSRPLTDLLFASPTGRHLVAGDRHLEDVLGSLHNLSIGTLDELLDACRSGRDVRGMADDLGVDHRLMADYVAIAHLMQLPGLEWWHGVRPLCHGVAAPKYLATCEPDGALAAWSDTDPERPDLTQVQAWIAAARTREPVKPATEVQQDEEFAAWTKSTNVLIARGLAAVAVIVGLGVSVKGLRDTQSTLVMIREQTEAAVHDRAVSPGMREAAIDFMFGVRSTYLVSGIAIITCHVCLLVVETVALTCLVLWLMGTMQIWSRRLKRRLVDHVPGYIRARAYLAMLRGLSLPVGRQIRRIGSAILLGYVILAAAISVWDALAWAVHGAAPIGDILFSATIDLGLLLLVIAAPVVVFRGASFRHAWRFDPPLFRSLSRLHLTETGILFLGWVASLLIIAAPVLVAAELVALQMASVGALSDHVALPSAKRYVRVHEPELALAVTSRADTEFAESVLQSVREWIDERRLSEWDYTLGNGIAQTLRELAIRKTLPWFPIALCALTLMMAVQPYVMKSLPWAVLSVGGAVFVVFYFLDEYGGSFIAGRMPNPYLAGLVTMAMSWVAGKMSEAVSAPLADAEKAEAEKRLRLVSDGED
ncbi:MAG TPA: hypothetical protein DGT21_22680 [Armatimonadetes bacterium]|jgi:hypothetical protein|nr:hypothetical protein [Armatimonadota bacterium]